MCKKILFLTIVLTAFSYAQSGYIQTPEQLYKSIVNKNPSANELFEKDFKLPSGIDLSTGMPEPGYQGKLGSCAAWAAGYACKTYQEAKEHDFDPRLPQNQFSPSFLYNIVNKGENRGSTLPDVFQIMEDFGVATYKTMPYTNDYLKKPDEEAYHEASLYKINNYKRLNNGAGLLMSIKSSLAAGQPVIAAMKVYENFKQLKDNIYNNIEGERTGGHGMCIVGYDDNKKTLKLINSWGKSWGEQGYCRIAYELVDDLIIEAYVLYDEVSEKNYDDLPAPENLQAGEGNQTNAVSISWDKVSGSMEYLIYRSNSKNEAMELIDSTEINSYNDLSVLNNVKYLYAVRAKKGDVLGVYSEIACGWASREDIGVPVNVKCTVYNNIPRLSWDRVENAEGYYIYRWKDNKDNYRRIAKSETEYFSDIAIAERENATYYYLVTAFRGDEESRPGNMVNVVLYAPEIIPIIANKNQGKAEETIGRKEKYEILPEKEQIIFGQELGKPDFYDSVYMEQFFKEARKAEEEAFMKMKQQEEHIFEQFRQQEHRHK
ncbi:hypothetical protein M0P98_08495 [bacterium]|nr:hypothetical protein [bacterium]